MGNVLTLAVAGSRKTQGIIDHCSKLPNDRKVLIVTYTQTNQAELTERLYKYVGNRPDIKVMGWFSFLLRDFAYPFIPFKFPNKRIKGFNFEGFPHQKAFGVKRFFDSKDQVFACELGRLASELIRESNCALIHRLECIYDEIHIDEVQDLSSHDLDILASLLHSSIEIRMVGDIRQAVISTNPRSSKNKKYKYSEAIHWFREKENAGLLSIIERNTTWRCHQDISDFSDTIFHSDWKFPKTISENNFKTDHDGVFLVRDKDADDYIQQFNPQCLRNSVSSGCKYDFNFMNFKVAKGRTFERVLIVPTKPIIDFVQKGKILEPASATSFYVAVTRAKQSVAILVPDKGSYVLPIWEP